MVLPVREWLLKNCKGTPGLEQETIDVIADFTLMWNFFEDIECNTNAGIQEFEQFADTVSSQIPDTLPSELLQFWKSRYVAEGKTNTRFERLNLRKNDRRDLVASVLLERAHSIEDVILALLIIVYRLRNNLFHGLKTIDRLNSQRENLTHAIKVLQTLMSMSDRPLYK